MQTRSKYPTKAAPPQADAPERAPAPFLEIRGLSARFTSQLGELDALEDVTFSVERGEFVCLVGPSGCGKSTLLRIVAGLMPPSEGSVSLEGQPRTAPSTKVGLVFQQPTLLPWRTVSENVALPLQMEGEGADRVEARVLELLRLVGLEDFGGELPANLSGGMAQRAAIARALAQNPEVLLLDEPFGALDALTREHMAAELLRIWERMHRTVLMVTHNVEEAALLADRVVVLSARPGCVMDIVPVNLPRPRDPRMLGTMALQRVAQTLRDTLDRGNGAR
ncbi:MAG: ABC transporter ATP-binding protein [Anaerolineae bacterium]